MNSTLQSIFASSSSDSHPTKTKRTLLKKPNGQVMTEQTVIRQLEEQRDRINAKKSRPSTSRSSGASRLKKKQWTVSLVEILDRDRGLPWSIAKGESINIYSPALESFYLVSFYSHATRLPSFINNKCRTVGDIIQSLIDQTTYEQRTTLTLGYQLIYSLLLHPPFLKDRRDLLASPERPYL